MALGFEFFLAGEHLLVVSEEGEVAHRCTGSLVCPAQRRQSILHFASRSAMDVQGLGKARIDSVIELPGLQSVASATATPASTSRRPGGRALIIRKNVAAGSSTPQVPASARAASPRSPAYSR